MSTINQDWTSSEIIKMFRFKGSRQTIANLEKSGAIPPSRKGKKGGREIKIWSTDQIGDIGKKIGFLKPPNKTVSICIYIAKGGTLKTTISYALARTLALNGIRVLLVGLDPQGSITDLALNPMANIKTIDDIRSYPNIGELLLSHGKKNKTPIKEVIQKTSIPYLDVIPENDDLSDLCLDLGKSRSRYTFIESKLKPQLVKDYEVIIYDNGPGWSNLCENSLYASEYVISPIGCEPGSYQAVEKNLAKTFNFGDEVGCSWEHIFIVPTLKDNNKLSSQIYAAYVSKYKDFITSSSIRRSVKGAEAFALSKSPLEHSISSQLAEDYYELISEIWSRIIEG